MAARFAGRLALAWVVAGLASGARNAPAGGEPPTAPVFGTEVSLVALPVFVVDRNGRALGGLSADDFELYDDGKRVRVVSFQFIDTTSDDAQESIRQMPAARRHFLLLFDLSFTDPGGLSRARSAAEDFVRRRLAESDLAAVATFDFNRGIRLVANFTEDRSLLVHAVQTLGVPSLSRISDPLALATSLGANDAAAAASQKSGDDVALQNEVFVSAVARRMRVLDDRLYRTQVATLINSLSLLGKSLRRVEGRKQVLYFSAGFDSQALVGKSSTSEMAQASQLAVYGQSSDVDSDSRFGDSSLRDVLSTMVKTLSSSDTVVHAMDVAGLRVDRGVETNTIAPDVGRPDAGRESLNYLASETGGRLFKDANDLRPALGEIADMTSRYYILGYQPDDLSGPGRFHKLKVRVPKGGRLSYRTGYNVGGSSGGLPVLERMFAAAQLVMTGAGVNSIHFSALCLPFPEGEGGRQTLGVVLQVPRGELPGDGPTSVEVYGYAVGEDGTVYDHLAQLARIDSRESDSRRGARGLSFSGALQVPPGRYTLKFMILEPESGASGVQFFDVSVPPREARAGFLLPPVVVDDPALWLSLSLGGRAGGAESPFATRDHPVVPRTSFRVQPGARERLMLISYEPERPTDPAAGLQIYSSLTDASGQVLPGGPIRIERVDRDGRGRRTYLLDYTPEGLAPGTYTLRIGIGEAGERLESYSLLRVPRPE